MTETDAAPRQAGPQGPPQVPPHMRRDRFDPVPELARLRADEGVRRVVTAFGTPAWLVTRHADVREVLGDAGRFSVAAPRALQQAAALADLSPQERAQLRAGNLLGVDPLNRQLST